MGDDQGNPTYNSFEILRDCVSYDKTMKIMYKNIKNKKSSIEITLLDKEQIMDTET